MTPETKRLIQQFAALLVSAGIDLRLGYGIETWCERNLTHDDMHEALWRFKEHDVVMLTDNSLADDNIHAGQCGTIVHIHDEDNFEVEFGTCGPNGEQNGAVVATLSISSLVRAVQ